MLTTSTLATSVPAVASTQPLTLLRAAPEEAAASVLGLDSKEGKTGKMLTAALRKAFANRGLSGGEEISLEEMRLTMGCTEGDLSCLSEGGRTLGVRRLVFGSLTKAGGGYQLDIQILAVESGTIEASAEVPITKAELAADAIDGTATRVVNELMPPAEENEDLPPRPEPLPEVDEVEEEEEPVMEEPIAPGDWYFGRQEPSTPRWKWRGFGTMLGFAVLTGAGTAGLGIWLRAENVGFRPRLLEEAEASQSDDNPNNDVNPNVSMGVDLCDFAREEPNEDGNVRNARITQLCDDAKTVTRVQTGLAVATGVFTAGTLVFTGLLLIHKRKPAANAMLRRGVSIGAAPNPSGGFSVSGQLRF